MDLQGPGAIVLTIVTIGLGVVGGSWLQHRIHGRRWRELGLRMLVTALSSLLVLVGVVAELNRENAWYANLSDLAGTSADAQDAADGTVVTTTTRAAAPIASLPPLPSPGNRIQRFQVKGASGITNSVIVVLPNGYFDQANARRRYPVLELGHGMPGHNRQWTSSIDIRKHLDPLVAQGKVGPAIAVLPEMEAPGNVDTECITSGKGSDDAMERWLADDVPSFVLGHFRAQTGAASWSTMGLSAGGWCSAMLTMLHPQQFGAGIVLGGYFAPEWPAEAPFGSHSARGRHYDLTELAMKRPPKVSMFLQSSTQDPEAGPASREFATSARSPLQVKLVMDPTGGHRMDAWAAHVDQALEWLASVRPAFRP